MLSPLAVTTAKGIKIGPESKGDGDGSVEIGVLPLICSDCKAEAARGAFDEFNVLEADSDANDASVGAAEIGAFALNLSLNAVDASTG